MTAPTPQSIFNRVAEHLLTQNAQSLTDTVTDEGQVEKGCAYRGSNGLKCAVGCLIADEHYSPELEGDNITSPPVCEAVRESIDPHHKMTQAEWAEIQYLLDRLQLRHDNSDPSEWSSDLDVIAAQFNLLPYGKPQSKTL